MDPTRKKIRSKLCVREYKTKKQGKIQRARPASRLFSAMPLLEAVKVLVSIIMSVSLVEQREQSTLPWNIPETHLRPTSRRRSSEVMAKTKLADESRVCMEPQYASHLWQLDYVKLICGGLGGFRRGKHSAALFHNPIGDVRMAVHGDDFVCLSDDDGLKHIHSLLKSKYTAKDMETLGF